MAPKRSGDKNLERILNIRVSTELAEALEETKWTLRKSMSELVRDAVEQYLDRNLKGDIKKKVNEILHKD
ncbi:MAG: ribbon-helix-helix domain-containing protein [Thermodesulfobacteriota bacterium]